MKSDWALKSSNKSDIGKRKFHEHDYQDNLVSYIHWGNKSDYDGDYF